MTDERLRRAARQAGQAGPEERPQAEERLLRERLRAGALDPQRVRLAAFLGHAAARALDPAAPRPPALELAWERAQARARTLDPASPRYAGLVRRMAAALHLRGWCEELAELGLEPLIRAGHLGLSAARQAQPEPVADHGPDPVRHALDAVALWLREPQPQRAAACLKLAEKLSAEGGAVVLPEERDAPALLRQGATLLAYAVEALVPASAAHGVSSALLSAGGALQLTRGAPPPPADGPHLPPALAEVLEQVRAGLLARALAAN